MLLSAQQRVILFMKKLCLSLHLLLALVLFSSPAWAKEKRNVLVLNSYHNGYRWSDDIMHGIRTVLEKSPYAIDLHIEYMDSKRYGSDEMRERLLDLYTYKFKDKHFDVVIATDNDAFNFLMEYGETLLPGVPLVFCGVNDLDLAEVRGKDVTGVVEEFDIKDTLNLALRLHPEKKHILVIGDNSTTGRAIRHQVEAAIPPFRGRLSFEFWDQFGFDKLLKGVENLPRDTFLFFIPFYQKIDGQYSSADLVQREVSRHTNVPIYSNWRFLLGYGSVGGKLLDGVKHGEAAAKLALRILGGEKAADIPVVTAPQGRYVFDYNLLQKWGIKEEQLPKGSQIINAPPAFYELPKEIVWTSGVFILVLGSSLVLLVVNIRQRKQVERKIKEQLSFQGILMDTIPQLVCWKDAHQRYLGANRAFTEFFGVESVQSIVHTTDYNLKRDSQYADWSARTDREVMHTRTAILRVRRQVLNTMGELVWLEINKVPLYDEAGNVVGTLSTAEDITRETSLEKQLLQSQKMEAIGTLAGGIAHDFNNVLTSIINSTELALGDIEENSLTGKDLERALRAAHRGSRLVKQILAFSRPSQEGFRPTDLGEVMREALGIVEASMPGNIEVVRTISEHPHMVWADPTQMNQVLMNLCTNAFQAMRSKGGTLRVSLESETVEPIRAEVLGVEPGEFYRVDVADDGPGIDSSLLDKIFDPFFTTKGKSEGTGLGLAVVHGIAKAHKGAVDVASEPGKCTVFRVYLPVSLQNADQIAPRNNLYVGRERVLFVEDDADQMETTPRVLESLGFSVVAESSPAQALLRLEADPRNFDLLITDYDMPGINGLELVRRVASLNPHLPVILVTGRDEAVEGAQALESIRMVVQKPYNKLILSDAIRQVLVTHSPLNSRG